MQYRLSQMTLAVIYPILLGLDRLENASLLRSDSTFQYLTGLPSYPDPQSLRRFLLHAPPEFRQQLHRFNDRLLQQFIHQPEHRSRLILDLDSTGVTVFGRQEGAEVGYNPRYRGKRFYDADSGGFRTPFRFKIGQCSDSNRTPFRLNSDSVPADTGQFYDAIGMVSEMFWNGVRLSSE